MSALCRLYSQVIVVRRYIIGQLSFVLQTSIIVPDAAAKFFLEAEQRFQRRGVKCTSPKFFDDLSFLSSSIFLTDNCRGASQYRNALWPLLFMKLATSLRQGKCYSWIVFTNNGSQKKIQSRI